MHRLLKTPVVATLALLVALLTGVATAHAAVAPPEWQAVDVTLFADESPTVFLVAATLPGEAKLPADAQLLVPAGAQPQWLGEIVGGDPSQDPSLETSVTKQGSSDVYSFRLFRSRTAQLEVLLPNAVTADGANFRASVTWPAQQDAAAVRLGVRLPKGAKIVVTAEGASLVTDDPTADYYTRTFKDVKAGTPVGLSVTYSLPTADVGAASGPRNSTLTLLLIAGLAVAVLALGVVIARSRRAIVPVDADDDADIPDGEDNASTGNGPDPGPDASAPHHFSPKALIAVVVVGTMVVAGTAAALNGTAPKASAEGITKQFAQGEACTVASIPLELASDAEPESEAKRIFAAVQSVPGIVYGTLRPADSRVEIGYCDSQASEEQIRAALVQAGFTLVASADGGASAGSVEASASE